MRENYPDSLKRILVHEGLFSNNPKDPGGATMKGVTQAVYDAYRRRKGQQIQTVKKIANDELAEIYDSQYWSEINGDKLPNGVDYAVFDYAVNSGAGRAVKDLQRTLGCNVDGSVGELTLGALASADPATVVADLCDRRLNFLQSLKTWGTFGKGWGQRVADVKAAALHMASDAHPDVPPPSPAQPPATAAAMAAKAPEAAQAQLKTADGVGVSAAGVGAAGQTIMAAADQVKPHLGETLIGRLALAGFVVLLIVGGALIGFSYLKRINEKGGLGPYMKGLLNVG